MFTRKTLTTLIVAVLLTTMLKAGNTERNEDQPGLEVSCRLFDDGSKFSSYTIIIYCDNQTTDTILVDKRRPVYFVLDYGHQYAIRHMAEGYRDRVVMIDTKVDSKIATNMSYFDYQIEMIRQDEPGNTINDLPVAVVRYDAHRHDFDYSRKYEKTVRGKHPEYVAGN